MRTFPNLLRNLLVKHKHLISLWVSDCKAFTVYPNTIGTSHKPQATCPLARTSCQNQFATSLNSTQTQRVLNLWVVAACSVDSNFRTIDVTPKPSMIYNGPHYGGGQGTVTRRRDETRRDATYKRNALHKFLPEIRTSLRGATELPTSQSAPTMFVVTNEPSV